ncbi:site-2 protease family protein [Brumimicrobium glaciale]|uniref:Site-2 protease family protein n=1 Tax=Brumimicrobium glaciale TaxID=200475 RepID=A0A4Q4KP36_9FLAO|nr:site-2 protease family protein [Brumimicrobium glaciale]RYM34587.1 site-2 protease family protein [Brumimicrobium glaciale]
MKRKSSGHISVTILSMVIFAITFSLILDDYYLIAILLGVLLFHELGHFLMMKLFNYEDLNMLFIPFMGAMVSGRKKEYSQVESSLMVIAGPLPGIILGAFLLLYGWDEPSSLFIQLGVILILLNVMNLIPIDPLDGGQLMRILFFNNYEFAQLIFTAASSLAIAGVGLYFNSWLMIIFGLLLGFRIKNKHKLYLIRKDMKDDEIQYESNYDDISNKTYSRIKRIIIEHTPVLNDIEEHNQEDRYNQIVAKQVEGVLFPPTKKDASVFFKIFMMILWAGGIFLSAYAAASIEFNSIINAFQNR